MKGLELSVTKQNGISLVEYRLGAADVYDDRVLDKVEKLENIIPFQYKDEDGTRSLISYVHNDTSLEVVLKKTLKKSEVLAILRGLLYAFEIGAAGVQICYLVRDTNYIYVDSENFTVKCMMVPVKQGALGQSDIPDFFRNIVSRMRFDASDNDDYVARILTLINTDHYSNVKLKELVEAEMEKIGLFYTKEAGIRKAAEEVAEAQPTNKEVKVNRVGVMNNMRPPMGQPMMNQQPPMGQPMMNQRPPMGQPMMNQQPPMGQPMMNQQPPMGQPMMNQQPPMGQPMMNQQPPMGQPMMNQQPPMGQPMMNQRPPMGQPMMNQQPVAPEMPKPAVPEMPKPVAPEMPKPAVPEMPKPVAPEMPKPAVPEMPKPVAPEMPKPAVPEMPKPTVPEMPKPTAPEMPKPTVPEMPKPTVPEMPKPTAPEMPQMGHMMMGKMPQGGLMGQLGGARPIPHFVRKKTGEVINITKTEFVIGKSKTKADYTIENNSAVSREHCIIVQRDGVNYIKDNNSTNHTYVNGVELQPGKEVLLKHKTEVRMGDEEFTFLLRKGE